jgi:serine/threonine protein kinase
VTSRTMETPVPAAPQRPAATAERFRDRLARELADRYTLEDADEPAREGVVRVFAAWDRRYDRRVILKVIHASLASQIDVERFVREIRLTGRLTHPHILPLLDSGEVAGSPWFAVPALDGETLRALLARKGAIPTLEAVQLTLDLADALGYAHAQGIIHRDVSPENVMVVGGDALLTNLGVARALDQATGAGLTATGTLVGSPAYMSPEQAEGARRVDARTDVYSLGAVLFEMLVGEPLFSGPTPQAIMAKRRAEPTIDPRRIEGLPGELAAVLRKALARDVGQRYASMGELAAALRPGTSAARPQSGSWQDLLAGLMRRWIRP